MSREPHERLADALLHFDRATAYGANGVATELEIDAICMRLASGLESLSRLPEEIRTELFGSTWAAMWGMRNRIAHTYAQVEAPVVIATLEEDRPHIRTLIVDYLGR
ncbi:DUF86 domain-containing protein [Demequina capsici]|uniref:DUF86 domain-containing protein n=1 Tax=Demequina capsici TaxID=3075620 RepID=A0AA96F911_9MICO|nr:HepT-like ribonuclease domain-containing protein [Demequina sp. PMTSA13]WNM26406.1 DUF86 domain-containing protein [Demequina sp. PMTSA13]